MARERRKFGRRGQADGRANRGSAAPAELAPASTYPEALRVHATLAIGRERPKTPAMLRGRLTALRDAWAAYSLKRAIADVASTSEQDYRHFGLDKSEMLQALSQLHHEIGGRRSPVADGVGGNGNRCPLMIVVSKARERRQSIGI